MEDVLFDGFIKPDDFLHCHSKGKYWFKLVMWKILQCIYWLYVQRLNHDRIYKFIPITWSWKQCQNISIFFFGIKDRHNGTSCLRNKTSIKNCIKSVCTRKNAEFGHFSRSKGNASQIRFSKLYWARHLISISQYLIMLTRFCLLCKFQAVAPLF